MDYFRFGTCAALDAPGGNVLVGLMGKLSTPAGAAPGQLLLAESTMNGGLCTRPAVNACELLVHVIDGSVLASVGGEEVRLIADNTVRVPAATPYAFSTEGSVGLKALLVWPLPGDTARPEDNCALPACCGDALSICGVPRQLACSSFDILASLTRLTGEGCVMPHVALARGGFNRDVILASLLPQYAEDPLALRALIWSCNGHPSARWWLDRARAKSAIEAEVSKLVTC